MYGKLLSLQLKRLVLSFTCIWLRVPAKIYVAPYSARYTYSLLASPAGGLAYASASKSADYDYFTAENSVGGIRNDRTLSCGLGR